MTKGPHEHTLDQYVENVVVEHRRLPHELDTPGDAGYDVASHIDSASNTWMNASFALYDLQTQFDTIGPQVAKSLGSDTEIGKAVLAAFKRVGNYANAQSGPMLDAAGALGTASFSIASAYKTRQQLGTAPNVPAVPNKNDPKYDNSDNPHKSGKNNPQYTADKSAHTQAVNEYDRREKVSLAAVQQVKQNYQYAIDALRKIRGYQDPTGGGGGNGGGGGGGGGGRPPSYPGFPTVAPPPGTWPHYIAPPHHHRPPPPPHWPPPPPPPPPHHWPPTNPPNPPTNPPTNPPPLTPPHHQPPPGTPPGHPGWPPSGHPGIPQGPGGGWHGGAPPTTTGPFGPVTPPTNGPGIWGPTSTGGLLGGGLVGGLTGITGLNGSLRTSGALSATLTEEGLLAGRGGVGVGTGARGAGIGAAGAGRSGAGRSGTGRRGAGAAGAGGRGGKKKRKKKRDDVDFFEDNDGWLDDEEAAPGVLH